TGAEQLVDYSARGAILNRMGNRSGSAAPQGIYKCRGDEQWLALSVESDSHWQGLCDVLGHPTWTKEPEFATFADRQRNHDALDEGLLAWTADQSLTEIVEMLVERGVPAGSVRDPREMSTHPQLAAW